MLRERVDDLARALNDNGILADAAVADSGVITLHTYNCPFRELAQEHREICEMDRNMLQKVLGSDVHLSKCMLEGHAGCTFIVQRGASGEFASQWIRSGGISFQGQSRIARQIG
jgi:DeoR family suf operon transcriptional repressor